MIEENRRFATFSIAHHSNLLDSKYTSASYSKSVLSRFIIKTPVPINLDKLLSDNQTIDLVSFQKSYSKGKIEKLLLTYRPNDIVFIDIEREYGIITYEILIASDNPDFAKCFKRVFQIYANEVPFISKDNSVRVKFWYETQNGPCYSEREIETFPWKNIFQNYPEEPQKFIETIVDKDWRPAVGNQLMLWTGPPGTGKTSALRCLSSEWKSWADIYYVMDPERFLNSPEYVTTLILRDEKEDRFELDEKDLEPKDLDKDSWKIIILEDAGTLISKTSTTENTAGLGRLLNICDGFIGQGLKILLIITSNEEIHDLNEAITRPGRTFGNILFPGFSKNEADEWMKTQSNNTLEIANVANLEPPYTLAKLYSALNGSDYFGNKPKASMGFK